MKKFLSLFLASLLLATVAFAGGGNVLASGEIEIAATTTPSTNVQTVALNGSGVNSGKEWSQVFGVIVRNNGDFATTTTVARVDLGDTTTLATAVAASNATTYASTYGTTYAVTASNVVPTTTVAPCAKDLRVTVKTPTNDAAYVLEYLIYGE